MVATIISGNELIALPDHIREALKLEDGETVSVEQTGDGVLLRKTIVPVDSTAGMLKHHAKHPPASIEEERAAFEQAVAREVASCDRA